MTASCDNDDRAGRRVEEQKRSRPLARDSCWRQSDMLEGGQRSTVRTMSPVNNKQYEGRRQDEVRKRDNN